MEGHSNRSLDDVYRAYLREVASGTENLHEATSIAFQYRVAKAQERWAQISAVIASTSALVAIAAVVVAAIK